MKETDRNELLLFFLAAFGPVFLMLPGYPMYYPAAGVMLATLVYRKEDPLLPKGFFYGFLALTGGNILWCLSGRDITLLSYGGALLLAVLYFREPRERRAAFGMAGRNWKSSALLVALFPLLAALPVVIAYGAAGEGQALWGHLTQAEGGPLSVLAALPLSAVLLWSSHFGEEYGWRGFLQGRLQARFGMIRGVLVLAVIWWAWHLPPAAFLRLFEGAALPEVLAVLGCRLLHEVGLCIYMAYAYGKTGNIWVPTLIHLLNNQLLSALFPPGVELSMGASLLLYGLMAAVYLPFLRSEVFRKPELPQGGAVYDD